MTTDNQNQGEGNREAAHHYNEKTRKFVKSGQVEEAAQRAANMSEQEKEEAEQAEEIGKAHARELDPEEQRDYSKPAK